MNFVPDNVYLSDNQSNRNTSTNELTRRSTTTRRKVFFVRELTNKHTHTKPYIKVIAPKDTRFSFCFAFGQFRSTTNSLFTRGFLTFHTNTHTFLTIKSNIKCKTSSGKFTNQVQAQTHLARTINKLTWFCVHFKSLLKKKMTKKTTVFLFKIQQFHFDSLLFFLFWICCFLFTEHHISTHRWALLMRIDRN